MITTKGWNRFFDQLLSAPTPLLVSCPWTTLATPYNFLCSDHCPPCLLLAAYYDACLVFFTVCLSISLRASNGILEGSAVENLTPPFLPDPIRKGRSSQSKRNQTEMELSSDFYFSTRVMISLVNWWRWHQSLFILPYLPRGIITQPYRTDMRSVTYKIIWNRIILK